MSAPEQKPKMQIPADMKAFNQALIAEFRGNAGKLSGPMAGRSLLLLTTKGARSGRLQTIVLGYGRENDRYIVIASNNGAPSDPHWYVNLRADPKATVELGADKFDVVASTAPPADRDHLAKTVPYLESQQKLTTRVIPLVILDRVG